MGWSLRIQNVLKNGNYELRDMNEKIMKSIHHTTRLKPAYSLFGLPIRTAA